MDDDEGEARVVGGWVPLQPSKELQHSVIKICRAGFSATASTIIVVFNLDEMDRKYLAVLTVKNKAAY